MVEKSTAASFWPALYEPFRTMGTRFADWIAPASEASSDDGGYRIALEIPGVAEGDIDVTVNEGIVTVKGEKKSEREEKGDTWYFSERQFGSFSRSFRLPADADAGQLKASLRDGVLTLTAPKVTPEASGKVRKVEIGRA
ncbi:MAG: Hsp20/alpha crystallin family protein [Pseudomonadota bacterium]